MRPCVPLPDGLRLRTRAPWLTNNTWVRSSLRDWNELNCPSSPPCRASASSKRIPFQDARRSIDRNSDLILIGLRSGASSMKGNSAVHLFHWWLGPTNGCAGCGVDCVCVCVCVCVFCFGGCMERPAAEFAAGPHVLADGKRRSMTFSFRLPFFFGFCFKLGVSSLPRLPSPTPHFAIDRNRRSSAFVVSFE